MIVIYEPNPLSKIELTKANKEGWNIAITKTKGQNIYSAAKRGWENKEILKYELEATKDQNNVTHFGTLEDVWRHIISNADTKNSLYERAANIIRFYNPDQCDELNMAFVPTLNKSELPTICTRCKKTERPKGIALKGFLPDYSSRCRWFSDKDKSWSIRIDLKVPWDYSEEIFYSKNHATYKIAKAHCKPCSDEMSKIFDDIFPF